MKREREACLRETTVRSRRSAGPPAATDNLPPVTVTRDVVLVDGFHRLEAAKRRGDEIPGLGQDGAQSRSLDRPVVPPSLGLWSFLFWEKNLFEAWNKRRKIYLDRLPNGGQLDPPILMHCKICLP